MIISPSKNFIFIHVYKVAGTSIRSLLQPEALRARDRAYFKCLRWAGIQSPLDYRQYKQHTTAAEIRHSLGADRFANFFSFAFVRNPWDWQVSLYHYMLQTPHHHSHDFCKSLGSFTRYIDWRCENEVRLQKNFLFENGDQLVQYIGQIENINNDLNYICMRIGIALPSDFELGKRNTSRHHSYRDYYNSRTRDRVAECIAEDIDAFDYTF